MQRAARVLHVLFVRVALVLAADRNGQAERRAASGNCNGSGQDAIDTVIPWSGPRSSTVAADGTDAARDRDNGELRYLLRSIAMHAPWVRKIWILVNGQIASGAVEVPLSFAGCTRVVDRCSFMPTGTCPTRNSFAVSAFAYLLPGVSERWLFVEDDIFLGQAVTPRDFFDRDGKPFVWRKIPNWGFFAGQEAHRIYEDPAVATFSTPRSSGPHPHYWTAHLKSVCASMHEQYREFYAFVGSHTQGRYSSRAKGISDEHNSQEEDWQGWMGWEYLRTGKGVYRDVDCVAPGYVSPCNRH